MKYILYLHTGRKNVVVRKQESMRNDQRALTQKKHNQEKQMLERQKKEAIISAKVNRQA